MSVGAYLAYKDSGVPWIGAIPTSWQVARFKHVLVERDERSANGDELLLSVSAYTGVRPRSEITEADDYLTRAESLVGYKIVQPDDLVINIMLAWNRGLGVSNFAGIVSPAYSVFISNNISLNMNFMNYTVRSDEYIQYFKAHSTGVIDSRLRLYPDVMFRLTLCLPPPAEQEAIAVFLDRETGKIDALVAEQERLMALLKEKRQAVISQAVTKGLNPNAKLKPSGVEWLGEVPSHWDVKRVKHAARLESGHTPSKQFPEYWEDGDIEWVSLNDSKFLAVNDYISDTAEKITAAGLSHSSARLLPEETVVFTRDATIGLAAITTKPMAVSQHLIAWCPTGNVLPLYLLRVFNVMKPFLDAFTFGATIKTIGMPDVRKLVTPVPPLAEQREIVAFIDEQKELIDVLVREADRAIALLKERRAALISAAVTGKIDVRDLAAAAQAAA